MANVVDEIVARQMAGIPIKPANPEGTITQGTWLDFNPVMKAMLGGLSEILGTAPSARVVDRLAQLRSPVLRPQTPFGWADYGAGLAADVAQTGLAGADLAALAPVVGRRAGQSLMNELGQVDVWHGSPHRFDKMSTEKIGTGEGNQMFGWGLYFSDKKKIAEHYAKLEDDFAKEIKSLEHYLKYNSKESIQKKIDQRRDSYERIKKSGVWDDGKTKASQDDIDRLKKQVSSAEEELSNYVMYEQKYKDFKSGKFGQNLYSAQLFPGKDPSEYTFLDWYKNVNQNKYKEVLDLAYKEFGADHPVVDALMKMNPSVRNVTGEGLYHTLSAQLGKGGRDINGQREASLFLKRAGIDGIRYPTETLSGKGPKGGGAYNYVVFDENDVRLVSRESGGVVDDLTEAAMKKIIK